MNNQTTGFFLSLCVYSSTGFGLPRPFSRQSIIVKSFLKYICISLPPVGLGSELPHPLCFDISSKRDLRSMKYSTNIRPIY